MKMQPPRFTHAKGANDKLHEPEATPLNAMTQIVTVSPATAAYAAQGMKMQTRANTLFEQRIHTWSEDAKIHGDARTIAVLNVIQPPALALALITATAPGMTPQVTVAEAQRLYDENGAPVSQEAEPA